MSSQRRGRAEISKGAVAHNVAVLRALAGDAKLCGVVKANAYGHGAALMARLLADAGIDYLGVALVDEALELRGEGLATPILVLGEASPSEIPAAIAHQVTLTVGSVEGAAAILATEGHEALTVHVKVDTGMFRQGLAVDEVVGVLADLRNGVVRVEGLFSHYPVADGGDDEDRAFTHQQGATFAALKDELATAGLLPPVTHLANTAGLVGYDQSSTQMVRPGLALYGYVTEPWLQQVLDERGLTLRPVLSLKAGVSALRRAPAGARPSYGRRRPLMADATIATVPFGYADGFERSLFEANQTVLIKGQRWPLAGVVTMDQLLIDVGDLDVALGDEVVLLGQQGSEHIGADEWARHRNTIIWEVLCDIGARVARVVVE